MLPSGSPKASAWGTAGEGELVEGGSSPVEGTTQALLYNQLVCLGSRIARVTFSYF